MEPRPKVVLGRFEVYSTQGPDGDRRKLIPVVFI